MFALSSLHAPLTAHPFRRTRAYAERPPCEALRPYIACFWGGEALPASGIARDMLIIPDTCVDLMYDLDPDAGDARGHFSGIDDRPFHAFEATDARPRFAIRFHFWAIHLFASDALRDTRNARLPAEALFPRWQRALAEPLARAATFEARQAIAERFLLAQLDTARPHDGLLNAAYRIVASRGAASVRDACAYAAVSQRQLERAFLDRLGLPMKRMAGLVRYQNVWRDVALSQAFDALDAVARYGYADQAHLIREFGRYHGASPQAARRQAQAERMSHLFNPDAHESGML